MRIHKEGYQILIKEFLIFTLVNYITYWNMEILFWYFTLPLTVFLFLISIYFFRSPKREFARKDGVVYSPCDGKIVVIEETTENEFYKDKRIQVSIFMSPLNIHNQVYPISGKVKYTNYHAGRFLAAWHPKASNDNEKSTIVVENNKISILFRQIAGAIARRIVTYSKVEDNVTVADEFGFIKFGSRVDLFFPLQTKINVELKEKVTGGQSIIATY